MRFEEVYAYGTQNANRKIKYNLFALGVGPIPTVVLPQLFPEVSRSVRMESRAPRPQLGP